MADKLPTDSESIRRSSGEVALASPSPLALSQRHREMLLLIARGLTNGEIGSTLCIAEDTVKTHLRRLMRLLAARNRSHLITIGFLEGVLVRPGTPSLASLPPGAERTPAGGVRLPSRSTQRVPGRVDVSPVPMVSAASA